MLNCAKCGAKKIVKKVWKTCQQHAKYWNKKSVLKPLANMEPERSVKNYDKVWHNN